MRILAAVACVLGLGCSHKVTYFKNQALGAEVDGLDWSKAKITTLPSGDHDYAANGDVLIGGVDHLVDVDDDVQPVAMGGKQTLTVTDTVMGQKRIYSYDPTASSLSFSDGTNTLSVVQNPDKSYSVNGMPAANGKAAVALLKQSPVYNDASAWGFVMTYSVCQSCLELASSRGGVVCTNGGNGGNSPPAVCDVFRDLCDCAACDKLGKNPCPLCP